MKKIKSFSDIEYIIKYKCDVKDNNNYNIPFVRFLSFDLLDIIKIINDGTWQYSIIY